MTRPRQRQTNGSTIARPVGLAALLTLLCAVSGAHAVDRFVALGGADTGPCTAAATPCATVAYALGETDSGDVVKIGAGRFQEALALTGPTILTLSGGWSPDFATRDPVRHETRLRGTRLAPIVAVRAGDVDLALDGLTITRAQPHRAIVVEVAGGGPTRLVLTGVRLVRNRAGGIALGSTIPGLVTLTLEDSVLERNRAAAGGVIRTRGDRERIEAHRTTFSNNRASAGGVAAFGDLSSVDAAFVDCTFTKNRATDGGVFHAATPRHVSLQLRNAALLGNRAVRGAAIHARAFDNADLAFTLGHSTLSRNHGRGAAIEAEAEGFGTSIVLRLTSTILWGNRRADAVLAQTGLFGRVLLFTDHSDVGEVTLAGAVQVHDLGNTIDADPLLERPRTNVHLRAGSPAIDAGTCVDAPPADLDGDPRPQGTDCDIGADERVP